MNKRKFLLVAIIPLLLSYHAQAQIVKWCIHPEYDEITYFGDDLFKCVSRTGKVQLYDRDGEKLLHNVDADSITDFAEGYAVALNGKKILGFLTQTGGHGFYPVSGEYMITKYPFFSEGLLVVADGKGKMGYMNVQGDLAIPCKYLEARPFKQGWASVDMAKKKVYYINFQGKTGNPDRFHGGNLTKGSSFNENGEAVVANYQDYAVIGTNMQVKRKIKYTPDFPVRSCDYAYSENTVDCSQTSDNEKVADNYVETYFQSGVYGYRWKIGGDDKRLPAQFSEAQPFFDGCAIVSKNGKYGMVELVDGEIVASWPEELRVYPNGQHSLLQFELGVPPSLDRDKVVLDFDEGNGIYKKGVPLDYEFKPSFNSGAKECKIRGKVVYDGLLLWEESKDVRIIRINVDMQIVAAKIADENDNQTVKATITNTSNVSISVSAKLNVAGQSVPFKGKLGPKQSKTMLANVKVVENKDVQAVVSVQADGHDCGSKTATVLLKKI